MKLLVVLENHFYQENNNIFCDRVIDYGFLKRYLNVFEKVIVCGRCDSYNDGKYKLKVNGPGVEFRPLPNFYGIKGLLKNILPLKVLFNKYINEVDAILYRVPTPLSIFTYKQVLKSNKVLAVEFMISADKMIEGKGFINKIFNKKIDNIAKDICLKANGVSYVTDYVLQEKYPCRAILNGNETKEYFTASYSTIELEKENIHPTNWDINKKPNTFHIIHTGYMDTYRKGQHTLIKAIEPLIKKGYNIDVTFIGDGKKKNEFIELAKKLNVENKINFLGLIKDKKIIFENLEKSHILVFPTEAEGLPRTLIEGMAVGLPCISSPVDGIPELLSDDYLIECNNVEEYTKKIEYLINHWDKMIDISKENYKKSKKYSKDILDEKRTNFYKKIYDLCKLNNKVIRR